MSCILKGSRENMMNFDITNPMQVKEERKQ
jgi:hypothetical protein